MNTRWIPLPLLLAVVGCSSPAAPAPAPAHGSPAAPPKVTVVNPQKKSLQRFVEQPGSVRAFEETPLFARLTGYVQKVYVDIGAKVKGPRFDTSGQEVEPGQVLAEIAVPEMVEEAKQKQALVRQAEAEVEQARKSLATAEASIPAADATVAEAKAGVKRAAASYDRWESESKRIGGLVRGGVVDRQTQDETENQLRAAGAARDEAAARVGSAEAMATKSRAERDKAEADVKTALSRRDVATANVRQHDAMLQYAKVRAPFDGVVTRRNVDTGHYLQPGKLEPLFVVAQQDRVRVSVEVPEADAALVKDGTKATVVIPALKALSFEGAVSRTAWGLDAGSRTLRTEIDLANAEGRLRPGMFVSARISATLPETFALPATALTKQGDATVCFLVQGGKAVRTPVQTGSTTADWTQVLKVQKAGASWGDLDGCETVAFPAANLADGMAVEVGAIGK